MNHSNRRALAAEVLAQLADNRCVVESGERLVHFATVLQIVRESLERSPLFPENYDLETMRDGAAIVKKGKWHYTVQERFEIGQLR